MGRLGLLDFYLWRSSMPSSTTILYVRLRATSNSRAWKLTSAQLRLADQLEAARSVSRSVVREFRPGRIGIESVSPASGWPAS